MPLEENENLNLHLKKSITHRYSLAVLIIALLATGAFYALHSVLNDSEDTALVVNLSGKQRMLSQHIALDVYRIYRHRYLQEPQQEQQAIQSLKVVAQEMALANKKLSSGQLSPSQHQALSKQMRALYFGETDLANRVSRYIELALQMADTNNLRDSIAILKAIDNTSENLLTDLNNAVSLYQKEGEQRIQFLAQMEITIWLFTLLALVLEVLFIFRPMANMILRAVDREHALLDSLNDQVELRTIKLKDANEKLMDLASKDVLTGIKNRMTLENDLENLIQGYQQNGQDFGVVLLDIDWFKKINDQYGHNAGDFILKEFAQLLSHHLRNYDDVYRVGGEEFVMLLNRIDLDSLLYKIETIKREIKAYSFNYQNQTLSITASFGVFHSSKFAAEELNHALKFADGALYQAKTLGRNTITVAKPNESSITHHLDKQMIRLQYQDSQLTHPISADFDIEALLHISAQSLLDNGIPFEAFVYDQDLDVLDRIRRALTHQQETSCSIRLLDNNKKVFIARLNASKHNQSVQIYLQSAKRLAQAFGDELLVYNFHSMLDKTNDYIYFKDKNHVFTAASKTLVELSSVNSREELVGKTDYDVFPKALADEYFKLEKEVFQGNIKVTQKFQPTLDKSGKQGWVDNRKYPIKDNNGNIIGLFGIARVITQKEYEDFQAQILKGKNE